MKYVGIIAENSFEYVESLLSIWNDDNVAVLIDWRLPIEQIQNSLIKANVSKCYIWCELTKIINSLKKNNNNIEICCISCLNNKYNDLPIAVREKYHDNYTDNAAIIFFSSGTTGKSKGVILTHSAIQKNADAIIKYMQPSSNDSISIVKSLSHSSTLVGELLVGLKASIPIYMTRTILSPSEALRWMNKTKTTILCLNPTLLQLYTFAAYKIQMIYLKKIYVSGSVLSVELQSRARNIFKQVKIFNVYGLTEAGPRVTAQMEKSYNKLGTVGRAINGVRVRIIDANGKTAKLGELGTIHVATPSIFSKYLQQENTNKFEWLNTGDFGYIDIEGDLYVVGRKDDMIVHGAYNIYPLYIENIICGFSFIEDCIVFGIPDELYGSKICCMYMCVNSDVNKQLMYDLCKNKLASYEIPNFFIQVPSLPMTVGGKKSRNAALKLYYDLERRDNI